MLYHKKERSSLLCASLASVIAIGISVPVYAQDSDPVADNEVLVGDDFHNRQIDPKDEIVVSAIGVTQLDILAGTSVMEGQELQRSLDGQLGEVLAKLPGVSATSFSPGASRPVLRGFSGERVRVLVDGIGAIDVSNTSADHATSIDPLTAERIEVLRGPAVLLYGSQAIGGAVNVIDKRIPQRRLKEPFHLDALLGADSAYDLREGGVSLDLPGGDGFVFHVDGAYRETDDVQIADLVASPQLRAELFDAAVQAETGGDLEAAADLRQAADLRDVLPNSATRTYSANAGFAYFADGSNLGASIGVYDTSYGVPGRPSPDSEESVSIGLRQYRADMRTHLDLGEGLFSALNTRVGFSDYTHTEFEGEEVGTVFDVKGLEARSVLEQNTRSEWRGSLGIQYYYRDFDAFGDEAYVPKNRTDQLALFALQEVGIGPAQLEFAGRYESTKVESPISSFERSFDTFSGAIGLAHETENGLRFGVTGSRAERAPSAEELLSNGPHIATQAFEIGNRDLAVESAWGLEASIRGNVGPASVSVAMFQNWFENYAYLIETGAVEDDLPVFQYLQSDAEYFGVEGQVTYPVIEAGPFTLLADLRGDYINAKLDDGTPLPRIPPLSLLGGLEAQTEYVDARVEVQWSAKQDRIAAFETPTDSFTYVNASLAWKPFSGSDNVTLLFQANNILDMTGRRHASFTKDFVPLAGRNFKVSVRTSL